MKKWILVFGLFMSLVLTACSGDNESEGENSDNNDENTSENDEDVEQILHFPSEEKIPTMDPSLASDASSMIFIGETSEGLYRLKGEEVVEGIAIDHEISDDGLVWTFNLREDAKWGNGDSVTAEDFVYSWRRALDPDTGSEYGPFIMGGVVENATAVSEGEVALEELGVEAQDDYTLEVTLEKPVPYFESLTTFQTFNPLNKEFVEEQGDDFATSTDTILFNGPFKLKDWESTDDSWEIEKNDDYWDADEINLEKVTYQVIKDTQTGVDLYESGDLDRTDLSSDLVDQYASDDDYKAVPGAAMHYIKLNQEANPALANKNIRKAIARSFDKEALVNEILNDGSLVSNGFVPADFVETPDGEEFREASGDHVEFDKEKAQDLWKKGLDEIGEDSVELELLGGDDDNAEVMQEYIANQMTSNLDGLDITIKSVPSKQRIDIDSNMDYDMVISGWGPDYLDPYTFLTLWQTDGDNNNTGFSDDKYDKLMEETENEFALEPEKRYDNFIKSEEILADQAVVAPIYQGAETMLLSPKVKDLHVNDVGPTFEIRWAEVVANE